MGPPRFLDGKVKAPAGQSIVIMPVPGTPGALAADHQGA